LFYSLLVAETEVLSISDQYILINGQVMMNLLEINIKSLQNTMFFTTNWVVRDRIEMAMTNFNHDLFRLG
jgi:hypothetical protein